MKMTRTELANKSSKKEFIQIFSHKDKEYLMKIYSEMFCSKVWLLKNMVKKLNQLNRVLAKYTDYCVKVKRENYHFSKWEDNFK